MGESRRKRQGALIQGVGQAEQLQAVDTLGGRIHVGWDAGAAATPHGQLVFFAEFLAATGVFERWVSACPLAYRSGNAPDKREVLGTLMLDVQVSSGKQHTSAHTSAHAKGRAGQGRLGLRQRRHPDGAGEQGQPYLLRLRQTANVQRLVARQFVRQDWSRADNQGCQMVEDQLQFHGWSKLRRVVVVRQRIKVGIARERRVDGKQLKLDLAGPSVHEGERLWEYAVMVPDAASGA